jgi:hypothetical protein
MDPLRGRVRLRGAVAGLGAALAAGGALWLWCDTRPGPSRPAPRLVVQLRPEALAELWQPQALGPRPSAYRYAALEELLRQALAQLQEGRIDRAALTHDEALERFGRHPAALASLGRYYLLTRDPSRLRGVLAELEVLEPHYAPLGLLRAEWHLLRGESGAAQALLEPLQDVEPPLGSRARLLLAMLAFRAGDAARARRLVDSVRESELELHDSKSAYSRLKSALRGEPLSGDGTFSIDDQSD